VYDPAVLAEAPDGFLAKDYGARELRGMKLTVQVAPDDCTGCGICVDVRSVDDPAVLAEAPDGFLAKDYGARELRGMKLTVQVAPDDCTGCGICVDVRSL